MFTMHLCAGIRREKRYAVWHDDRADCGHAARRADGGRGPAAARDALVPRDGRRVGSRTGRRALQRLLRALPVARVGLRALRLSQFLTRPHFKKICTE